MTAPKVTWCGRDVQHPVLRALVMMWVGVWLVCSVAVMVLTAPVWLLLDPLLKKAGRAGFVQPSSDGRSVKIVLGPSSFARKAL